MMCISKNTTEKKKGKHPLDRCVSPAPPLCLSPPPPSCFSKDNTEQENGKHPLSLHSSMSGGESESRKEEQEFPVLILREIANTGANTRTSPSRHPSQENTQTNRQRGKPRSRHHTLNILGNDSSQCGIVGNSGNGSSMSFVSNLGRALPCPLAVKH